MAEKTKHSQIENLFKRREALEAKLFRLKYAKLMKLLSSASAMSAMKKDYTMKMSSIYEENPQDHSLRIKANRDLFENVVKEAFNVYDSSDSEEEINKRMTEE